ncbi:MAG: beta-ketoacyl-[acyl-carrier-protein] synthase family protein, partial [Thermoleophilia bacterium]|nr:beta-ketoacyl-[acyl-carrier-protein] synthase family protein [Thermoleophilia bacterium]
MATHPRRAVLTGFGVLSPIGCSPDAFWTALLRGDSGVRRVRSFDASGLKCQIAGEVLDFDAKSLIDKGYRKALNAMARASQLGVVAAQFAARDARLARGAVAPERFGTVFAAAMSDTEIDDLVPLSLACARGPDQPVDMAAWGATGVPLLPPMWLLKYLPNMPACHATIMNDARGPSNSLTPDDLAGLAALGEAFRLIRRGAADVVLVGGCESKVNPVSFVRHDTFSPLTGDNDDSAGAVKPFDAAASGTCLGEGASAFGLEELEHARARGAPILGEVVGFASGVDRGLTGQGFARVIRNALASAGTGPGEVDHVNAHGLGVPELDAFEARGIAGVFGPDVPVFAPLSRFGNLGAA